MVDYKKTVIVTGPTATGKTALAVKLADKFDGEIISVDSRQVYRGMDIGTGKDLLEYNYNGRQIPHHMLDVVDPEYPYNLHEFCRDAWQAIAGITVSRRLPILCGGSALYLDALISGYELPGAQPNFERRNNLKAKTPEELGQILQSEFPEAFASLKDKTNKTRLLRALEKAEAPQRKLAAPPVKIQPLLLGVYFTRQKVHARIEQRLDARLAAGMIEEVQRLHDNGITWERLEFFGLEYRYIAEFLQGKCSREEMREKLLIKIRQFAKRQDIWFRKLEREGWVIHWIPEGDLTEASKLVDAFLNDDRLPAPEIQLKNIDYGKK
ncbi:tRNA (adenosine(37)-N6)-dimethylallyltransferase MiaA [Lentisphaerota bacterium ZTH]|nr:tRNA (adenosine(37)-N6)-dimethylallyltransferase MiaA [Lentisphaerota bacterium]WET05711.1 tRNA (adenosine(37)-N6)-dimethylallyltransferase MiaA [Lentisphaerota bacterium ZTH]